MAQFNENGDAIVESRDILAEIANATRARIAAQKANVPLDEIIAQAQRMPKDNFAFEAALRKDEMAFICEIKKASPSKGLIAPDFPYLEIAKSYQAAGASAISCLTEPDYFQGCDTYLSEITSVVSIPVLRKDFFVDPYMIYQAKVLGASAILLICAILSDAQLRAFFVIAESLGLSAIFEAHDAQEVTRALACGARIVGVNNRNLKTFALDLNNSITLRKLVPNNVIFISESGIKTRDDIALLEQHDVNAVLIGETFMRVENKKATLDTLRGKSATTESTSTVTVKNLSAPVKIKICGLRRAEDIDLVNAMQPDYIGFVFAKSKRNVTPETAAQLKAMLSPNIQTVGVFVNHDVAVIHALLDAKTIDVVQLHGTETEEDIRALKTNYPTVPIIKAVSVTSASDNLAWADSAADYLLLDNGAGGSGKPFDWAVLPTLSTFAKPYFIAGGLTPSNVTSVLPFAPYGVDVSSGVESTETGYKDPELVATFIHTVRKEKV